MRHLLTPLFNFLNIILVHMLYTYSGDLGLPQTDFRAQNHTLALRAQCHICVTASPALGPTTKGGVGSFQPWLAWDPSHQCVLLCLGTLCCGRVAHTCRRQPLSAARLDSSGKDID